MWIVFRSITLIIPFENLETVYAMADVQMTEHCPLGKFFSSAVSVTKDDNSACNMESYFVACTVRFTKAISPDSSKADQWFLTGNIEKTILKVCVQSYHNYYHNYSQRCIFTNMGKLETRTKCVRTAPSLSQFPKDWLHERLKNYVCR